MLGLNVPVNGWYFKSFLVGLLSPSPSSTLSPFWSELVCQSSCTQLEEQVERQCYI